ncbi:hypothetical protein DMA11_07840 [Marinilabiliaceae bacterium JC017]|nr:hypothetical protein DMA11_07840 [Marinilabiliaceae bacterium JC017]
MTNSEMHKRDEFEDTFEQSLRALGHLFPISEEEVELFETFNEIEKVPDHFPKADEMLSGAYIESVPRQNKPIINQAVGHMNRAARKGNGIPDDILRKMKQDRNQAENENE